MIVPPMWQDPGGLVPAERLQVAVDHPAPAVQDADRLVAVLPQPPADGADDRVEPGAVAAACEHSDPHRAASLATTRERVAGNRQARMLTARAATRSSVTNEIDDCTSIRHLAGRESGRVSVGLNALEFVNET